MSEKKVLDEIEDELKSLQQARKLERDTLKGIQFKMRAPVNQTIKDQIQPEQQIEVEGHTVQSQSNTQSNAQSANQTETLGEEPIFQRKVPHPVNKNQIPPGASRLVRTTALTLLVLGVWGGLTAVGMYYYSKDEQALSKNVRVRMRLTSSMTTMVGGKEIYISEEDQRRLKRLDDIDRDRRAAEERNSWTNYLPDFMRSKKKVQPVVSSEKASVVSSDT